MAERATTCGKQVLLDGENFAQARDDLAAATIAVFLNHAVLPCNLPVEDFAKVRELFSGR
jgi:hypothetical protein